MFQHVSQSSVDNRLIDNTLIVSNIYNQHRTPRGGCGRKRTEMMIHIGQEIEAELRRQGHGATWLAQRLHCDRTNVYNIFKRESIDTILLQRIGSVLKRNFFMLYCPQGGDSVNNPGAENTGAENNATET